MSDGRAALPGTVFPEGLMALDAPGPMKKSKSILELLMESVCSSIRSSQRFSFDSPFSVLTTKNNALKVKIRHKTTDQIRKYDLNHTHDNIHLARPVGGLRLGKKVSLHLKILQNV